MICITPGCIHPAHARGLCHTHYAIYRRSPAYVRVLRAPGAICARCKRIAYAGGLCQKHYMQQWREAHQRRLRPRGSD